MIFTQACGYLRQDWEFLKQIRTRRCEKLISFDIRHSLLCIRYFLPHSSSLVYLLNSKFSILNAKFERKFVLIYHPKGCFRSKTLTLKNKNQIFQYFLYPLFKSNYKISASKIETFFGSNLHTHLIIEAGVFYQPREFTRRGGVTLHWCSHASLSGGQKAQPNSQSSIVNNKS